ncbi:MAG: hypothetical protein RLY98_1477 [Bacteroidota bacterium]|jgi:hypothetical protein
MSKKKSDEERIQKVSLDAQPLNITLKDFKEKYSNQEKLNIYNFLMEKGNSIRDIEVYLGKPRNGTSLQKLKNAIEKENKLIKNTLPNQFTEVKNDLIEQPIEGKNNVEEQFRSNTSPPIVSSDINNLILEKLTIIQQLLEEKNKTIAEQKLEEEKKVSLTFFEKQKDTRTFIRSYRLNLQVATLFGIFCTVQNFSQQDLLSQALFEFIQKYSSQKFMDEYYNET